MLLLSVFRFSCELAVSVFRVKFLRNNFAELDIMGPTKRSKGADVKVGIKQGTYKLDGGRIKVPSADLFESCVIELHVKRKIVEGRPECIGPRLGLSCVI